MPPILCGRYKTTSTKNVDDETRTKDILEAIDTFIEKGLIKECTE